MKVYNITESIHTEERELSINIAPDESGTFRSFASTNIGKYIRKLKKQGWIQTSSTLYKGIEVAADFEAPTEKSISIGKAIRPKRVMSEEHLKAIQGGKKKNV